mmetsp:Transcript_31475/g.48144  ORF Transcript_31475/g.48144 Transcript_31475/m.48144 type:complete len:81 (+) Transcript_31475:578-820(+)
MTSQVINKETFRAEKLITDPSLQSHSEFHATHNFNSTQQTPYLNGVENLKTEETHMESILEQLQMAPAPVPLPCQPEQMT